MDMDNTLTNNILQNAMTHYHLKSHAYFSLETIKIKKNQFKIFKTKYLSQIM